MVRKTRRVEGGAPPLTYTFLTFQTHRYAKEKLQVKLILTDNGNDSRDSRAQFSLLLLS